MLPLESHLERVLAVNLGQVVRQLERRTDFIGGQESVTAQGRESVDAEGWKPAVLFDLRNILNAKLPGRSVRARSGRSGGVQIIKPGTSTLTRFGEKTWV